MKRVFVAGAARSGTTLLNSLLLTSGNFAQYRAETLMLSVARRRYRGNRSLFLKDWYRSRQYLRSGLSQEEFEVVFSLAKDYVDLLRKFMDAVAEKEGAPNWSDSTPAHIFYMNEILSRIPNSYCIHMIRDGRSVALSQERLGWVSPPFGLKSLDHRLMYAGLQWMRCVDAGVRAKAAFPNRVLHVRYEDLVDSPANELARISTFLDIDISGALDKDISRQVGSLVAANTPFSNSMAGISKDALERYKSILTDRQISLLNATAGGALTEWRYASQEDINRSAKCCKFSHGVAAKYGQVYLTLKSLAIKGVLGRFTSTSLEYED